MTGNKIGWCDKTVNPVQGCKGKCSYCYARDRWNRFKGLKGWCKDFSQPQFFHHKLNGFRTRKPQIIFIDSMSDIAYWEPEWKCEVLEAMAKSDHNIYLSLTKNIEKQRDTARLIAETKMVNCPNDFYAGVTVTNNHQANAVTPAAAAASFISFEPLMERIDVDAFTYAVGDSADEWVMGGMWWIIGDLTKHGKPQGVTQKAWVQEMVEFCRAYNIPVFMKDSIKELMGDEFVQEFPEEFLKKLGRCSK